MNRYLSILIIIFLSVVSTACGNSSSDLVRGEGYILEKNDHQILVLDRKFEGESWDDIFLEYEGPAIWITTKAASKYEQGQKIQYWLKPGINDSYPSQASAQKIKIVEE